MKLHHTPPRKRSLDSYIDIKSWIVPWSSHAENIGEGMLSETESKETTSHQEFTAIRNIREGLLSESESKETTSHQDFTASRKPPL
jgi:hypothetical protein